ncbi:MULTISPECIES: hypothetical protein [Burkholderia]|uniref:hypothetical protein n=1 Tax=Burkholderia TaxID=32008 RepID=UPI001177F2A3|nr:MULTISPECIES: hypothetical protein [Burkholderia]MBY4724638.1 hypothetical protein [Burkholderia contaminans]MCI3972911.1 hypothetical protein [Burkholderia sp. HI4860]MDN7788679.1 hypothetical protein [Burkholderia contaminans]
MNKHKNDEHLRDDETPPVEERAVVINVARTIEALRGPFVVVPAGLTREEKRRFILSHAK